MRIQTLKALICVEERGSIRAAAECMFLSQPALSIAIKQLEEEVGAPLLVRSRKGVGFTNFGQAFLSRARLIVAETRKAQEEIAQLRGHWHGNVRLATSPAVGLSLLPHALRPFIKKHPQVMVHCFDGLYPGVIPALRAGMIDFAVTPVRSESVEADLVAEPLCSVQVVIVARRFHPLAKARTLARLRDGLWAFSTATKGPGAVIEDVFQAAKLGAPRCGMVCESLLSLPGIVANSDLLTTLPHSMLNRNAFRDELTIIPVKEAIPSLEIGFLRLREVPLTPAALELVGWIKHVANRSNGKRSVK